MRDVLVVCVYDERLIVISPLSVNRRVEVGWQMSSFHVDLPGSGSGHPARIRTVMYD